MHRPLLLTMILTHGLAQATDDWVIPENDRNTQNFSAVTLPKGQSMTSMRATWIVPPRPANEAGGTVAVWDGFETNDANTILQPVLQWQKNHFAGWWISCFVVSRDPKNPKRFISESSPEIAVEPGTELTGVMELVSRQGGLYTYKCYFENYPGSALTYTSKEPLNSAWVDYETHKIERCDQYTEGLVQFRKIEVRAGRKNLTMPWYKDLRYSLKDPLKCGMKIKIVKDSLKNGEIHIGIPAKQKTRPRPPLANRPSSRRAVLASN